MVTNPNTLGLFEEEIEAVAEIVHARGGLVYMDGANMNALMGVAQAGRHGRRRHAVQPAQDVLDAARRRRARRAVRSRCARCSRRTCRCRASCGAAIGFALGRRCAEERRPRALVLRQLRHPRARATRTSCALGGPGLERGDAARDPERELPARAASRGTYHLRVRRAVRCTSACSPTSTCSTHDVHTLDVAKRLLDYGFYAPTIYFPLVVKGALMIEPTETESEGDARRASSTRCWRSRARRGATRTRVRDAPHRTWLGRLGRDPRRAAARPALATGHASPRTGSRKLTPGEPVVGTCAGNGRDVGPELAKSWCSTARTCPCTSRRCAGRLSLLYQDIAQAVDDEYRTFDFASWADARRRTASRSGSSNAAIRVPRVILLQLVRSHAAAARALQPLQRLPARSEPLSVLRAPVPARRAEPRPRRAALARRHVGVGERRLLVPPVQSRQGRAHAGRGGHAAPARAVPSAVDAVHGRGVSAAPSRGVDCRS